MTDIGAAGTFRLGDREVNRLGYGAMRLSGPGIYGPPQDRDQAVAVLREAVASGVNHIDTSDYYGPHVTNEIIREALSPYPDDLVIVTKLGARRTPDKAWLPAMSADELRSGLEDNLNNLGLERMEVVNLRFMGSGHGPSEGSVAREFEVLAGLQQEGLIGHLGLSNVSMRQVDEAQRIAPVVCVQNQYNVVHREDDEMIVTLGEMGVAYVPFFPLGGFTPLQSDELSRIAADLDATAMQVALAWLLQRSPNILLIPGTSSLAHLRENLAAAKLVLPHEVLKRLDAVGESVAA
ncbi:MAG TPA: aldo/keto reductase family oxidoreductase [Sphingomicrobium sp.]|nr:aldo/keto reductase family oxidoreductase [Sphingomicrobium sp.]